MTANNVLTYRFRDLVAVNGPGPVTHYMAPADALALAQDLEAAARDCLGTSWADSTLEQGPPRLAYPVQPRGVAEAQERAEEGARVAAAWSHRRESILGRMAAEGAQEVTPEEVRRTLADCVCGPALVRLTLAALDHGIARPGDLAALVAEDQGTAAEAEEVEAARALERAQARPGALCDALEARARALVDTWAEAKAQARDLWHGGRDSYAWRDMGENARDSFESGVLDNGGRVPVALCEERAATRGDVLGCRSHRNAARAGEGTGTECDLFAWRVVSHETESAARAFAHARGVELSN